MNKIYNQLLRHDQTNIIWNSAVHDQKRKTPEISFILTDISIVTFPLYFFFLFSYLHSLFGIFTTFRDEHSAHKVTSHGSRCSFSRKQEQKKKIVEKLHPLAKVRQNFVLIWPRKASPLGTDGETLSYQMVFHCFIVYICHKMSFSRVKGKRQDHCASSSGYQLRKSPICIMRGC